MLIFVLHSRQRLSLLNNQHSLIVFVIEVCPEMIRPSNIEDNKEY